MAKTKRIAITGFCLFSYCASWIIFFYSDRLTNSTKQPTSLVFGVRRLKNSPKVNKLQKQDGSYLGKPSALPETGQVFSNFLPKALNNSSVEKSAIKIILMWNAWSSKMEDKPLMNGQCQVRSCIFTTDMSLLKQSDIVVLHYDTLEDYPLNRQPHQRFVFFQFESPENTASTLMDDPRFRYDYFNWTMTYRRDSDIFLRDFYGSLIAKPPNKINGSIVRYKYDNVVDSKLSIFERPVSDALIRRKKKMVTWFVGHCQTPIRREKYVQQLSQFVSVDVFGRCTKKCPYHCDEMLRADYKFYLAFENSWCPDYVTEKFIRPFVYDAVPIVLGGANYSQFAPPNSYINAKDFKSPKELADYLIILDKSNTLYAQYFNWKRDYYVSTNDMYGWCELCRMANDQNLPKKVYRDIKKWWMFEAGECETDSAHYF